MMTTTGRRPPPPHLPMARSYGLAYYLYRQYTSAGTRAEQIADPDERAEFWAATHEVRPSPMGV